MPNDIKKILTKDDQDQQAKLIGLFYDVTMKAREEIAKLEKGSNVWKGKGLLKATENMLEQSMARERNRYWSFDRTDSKELVKKLKDACTVLQFTLDAILTAMKLKMDTQIGTPFTSFVKYTPDSKLPIEQQREYVLKYMLVNYYIYELDTRHQAELAQFETQMENDFDALNIAKNKLEGYGSTIRIKDLGNLKSIWQRAKYQVYLYDPPRPGFLPEMTVMLPTSEQSAPLKRRMSFSRKSN